MIVELLCLQSETLVSNNSSLLVSLLQELTDRDLLTNQCLVQKSVLLEELTHLTLGDLCEDSLWLVSVLWILLHHLQCNSLLLLNNLCWAVVLVD